MSSVSDVIRFSLRCLVELPPALVEGLRKDPPLDYVSTTSMPQPLGPTIYRNRFRPDTPAEQQAQITVVVAEEIVRDASDPEQVRLLVAASAADGFDELRRNLRRREAGSPGIEPGPSG